ncbi:MAG: hypothetical protein HYZ74_00270, partial [Elusimicrobia bacterium]|nr:hypothetical protein [Elusimicrobiota bacterium]
APPQAPPARPNLRDNIPPSGPELALAAFRRSHRVGDIVTFLDPDGRFVTGKVAGYDLTSQRVNVEASGTRESVGWKVDAMKDVRKGRSTPALHRFTQDDIVTLTHVQGSTKKGRVVGYTNEGKVLFVEESASSKQVLELSPEKIAGAKYEYKAPSAARLKGLPAEETFTIRKNELPYHLPPVYYELHPGKPLPKDALKVGGKYIYVVRYDGVIVVAPEYQSGFSRGYVKHRDLVPAANGEQGLPARFGGEIEILPVANASQANGKRFVLLIDGGCRARRRGPRSARRPDGARPSPSRRPRSGSAARA